MSSWVRAAAALAVAAAVAASATGVIWRVHSSSHPVDTATVYAADLGAVAVAIMVLLALGQWWWKGHKAVAGHPADPATHWVRLRPPLIARVRHDWVAGVLEPSLRLLPCPLSVKLVTRPEVVAASSGLAHAQSAAPKDLLAAPIAAYDRACGRLLVLGQPGTGKTTLLLSIAQELLERACADRDAPIPVVFHAATWNGVGTFSEWLVSELGSRYGLPAEAARSYLEYGELVPLVDGLDELADPQRVSCAAAINAFREQRGLFPFVVCCRTSEYESLAFPLRLDMAVEVQPLSPEEVRQWAGRLGAHGVRLRRLLASDAALRELVTTPLMLGVAAAVAASGRGQIFGRGLTRRQCRKRLFDLYIEQALTQTPRSRLAVRRLPFTEVETRRWLARLAGLLRARDLGIFYPDWIQPDWLTRRWQRLAVCQGVALVPALAVGVSIPLTIRVPTLQSIPAAAGTALLLSGYILAFGSLESISPVIRTGWISYRLERSRGVKDYLLEIPGVLFVVIAGVVLATDARGVGVILALIVILRPVALVVGGIVSRWARSPGDPADIIGDPARGLAGLLYALRAAAIRFYMILEALGIMYVLATFMMDNLADDSLRSYIRRQFLITYHADVRPGLPLITAVAVIFLFWNVLGDYVRFSLLRALVVRDGVLPRGLIDFLDSASTHLLLRRAGYGYLYMHPLLLDHLADEAGPTPPPVASLSGRQNERIGVCAAGLAMIPFTLLAEVSHHLELLIVPTGILTALALTVWKQPVVAEATKLPNADWDVPYLGIAEPQLEYFGATADRRVTSALQDPCTRSRLLDRNAALINGVSGLARHRHPNLPGSELHSSVTEAVVYGCQLAEDSPHSTLDPASRGALRGYAQAATAHSGLVLYAACTAYMMCKARKSARRKLLRRLRQYSEASRLQT